MRRRRPGQCHLEPLSGFSQIQRCSAVRPLQVPMLTHSPSPLPSPADEPLPLILIGPGRTLRLRNVRLVNAASLAVCLQLAPGGLNHSKHCCVLSFCCFS